MKKLKIAALLCFLLIALTVAAYLAWSHGAGSDLDKQVAVYKAAGEPIEPADFLVPHIDDEDNAAVALREAARVDETSKEWKAADGIIDELGLPLRDKEVAAFRAVVRVNPNAFSGVDDAMKRKGIDWQIPMKSPVISVLLPDLNEQRRLANLLSWSAYLHFHDGDHLHAIGDLHRIVFISRTLDLQPTLVSHLVSLGLMRMTTAAAERMAPELKIGSSPGDASPEQVKLLIAFLLNDDLPLHGRRRALFGERMIELDITRCISNGTLDFSSIGTGARASPAAASVGIALKPLAYEDGVFMMRRTTATLAAAEASPNWPTYQSKSPGGLPAEITENKFRHLLANIAAPAFDRAIETEYRAMTDRRLAAIALAIRWYQLDHAGQRPEKLSVLVPGYLPAVPLDPMAKDAPLRYVGDATAPILYSVGSNGIDDGGSQRVAQKRGAQRNDKWDQADYVVPLTAQPRPPEEKPDDNGVSAGSELSTRSVATQPATAPTN